MKLKQGFLIACSLLMVSGCSLMNDDSTSNSESVAIQEDENYTTLKKEIEDYFNKDKQLVKVEVMDDVSYGDENGYFTMIEITADDQDYRKELMAADDAISTNTDSFEEKQKIIDIQTKVKEFAQKLNNDVDVVRFGYFDADGRDMTLAESRKGEDLVPIMINDHEQAKTESDESNSSKNKKTAKNSKKNLSSNIKYKSRLNQSNNQSSNRSNQENVNHNQSRQSANDQQATTGESQETYWERDTEEHVSQPDNGYGDYYEYDNDYGVDDSYYETEPNDDNNYVRYFEDEDGNLIENPIYKYRDGE